MKGPVCDRIAGARCQLGGFVGDYLKGITEQWLLVAPRANPAMLEMFRDRDSAPVRDMVPWAGEFAGKYLTSAVQVLRLTGDPHLRKWLTEFVSRLISLQDEDGYLGPWPKRCRMANRDSEGRETWDTWGHYHVMMGLILWHEETGDGKALECVARIADLICRKYLGRRKTRLVDTGSTEMNLAPVHALCILHARTGNKRCFDMALQIVEEFAAEGEDGPLAGDYLRQALAGKEFFDTPKPRWESLHSIMALTELHKITGEQRYCTAFEHLWWSILKGDRHNSGGFSSGEKATGNPYPGPHVGSSTSASSIDSGPIETCCTIAWIAMSVEMLRMTGDSVVADEMELSTLNSVVGMHSCTGRWATYNTPMSGVRRGSAHENAFQAREGSPELNCCSVNASRGFGMISDWALMRAGEGFILNWYGPSVMKGRLERGLSVALTQETNYPLSGAVRVRIAPSRPAAFGMKLRIPYWSRRTKVALNGRPVRGVAAGRYLALERRWSEGDVIDLELDMSLHLWPGEQGCKGLCSVYRGPILLAYDHRYNLELAPKRWTKIRDYDEWKAHPNRVLKVPPLDAGRMKGHAVDWRDWLPPILLMEFEAVDGERVCLCDYGSAGEAGTPYVSWLPIRNAPTGVAFARDNPLRSARP